MNHSIATKDELVAHYLHWPPDPNQPGGAYTSRHRFLRVASMLTTGPLKPWMAHCLADTVGVQADIDDLRANLQNTATMAGAPSSLLADMTIQDLMSSTLLASPDSQAWQSIATYKPGIKKIVRTLVEASELARWLYEVKAANSPAGNLAALANLDVYNWTLLVAQTLRMAELPLRLPYQMLDPKSEGDAAKIAIAILAQAPKLLATIAPWDAPGYNYEWKTGQSVMAHVEPPALTMVMDEPPVPKLKKKAGKSSEPPVPPMLPMEVDPVKEKQKVEALLQAVKKMVTQEVQQSLLTNTPLLESLVSSVLAASPVLLNSALAKVMTGQKGLIQQQVTAAVSTAMSTMNLQAMVQSQVAQSVTAKLDLNKMRQEIADKMLHSSDDYFAAVFDRIEVVNGKLTIKDPVTIKAPSLASGAKAESL